MKPTFLEFRLPLVGEISFPAYMTMLLVGFLLMIVLARRAEDRAGRDGVLMVDLSIWMLILGVLGARLASVFFDGKFDDFVNLCMNPKLVTAIDAKVTSCTSDAQCGYDYLCDTARNVCYPPQDCLAALKFWQSGLTYYGGFLLAAPFGLWFAKRKNMGVLRVGDVTAPYVAWGLFFGRLGCFFNGCCYGEPTTGPLGMRFPGLAHPRHPTQLYEALAALAIAAFLYYVVRPRKVAHGQVLGALLVLYGIVRFVLEYWRDDQRGGLWVLSTSQIISIPLVAAGAALIGYGYHTARTASTHTEA